MYTTNIHVIIEDKLTYAPVAKCRLCDSVHTLRELIA